MRTSIVIFLSALTINMTITPWARAGIGGSSDRREVVGWTQSEPWYCNGKCKNLWNTDPYWNYVFIVRGRGSGTGQWISPKHILTNKHVANACGTGTIKECVINTSDNNNLLAKVVKYGGDTPKYSENDTDKDDWSILEITWPTNYKHPHWFNIGTTPKSASNLWRAGFGALAVLSPQDIKDIRAAYSEWLKIVHPYNLYRRYTSGKNIDTAYNGHDIYAEPNYYKTFLEIFNQRTGRDFMQDYMRDNHTLKAIHNCDISQTLLDGTAMHSCQSWAGDSGSSIQQGKNVVLLNKSGTRYITSGKKDINIGIQNSMIFGPDVMKMLDAAKQTLDKH